MKSCNPKRRQQREPKNKSAGLISKKATLEVQPTFLYSSLPLFCTTTTWNFLVYTRFIEEMSYEFLYACFDCRSFLPCGVLAFLFFLTAAIKFSCCPSNVSFVFFISRSCSFSVIHVRLSFVVCFLEKSGWPCDLPPETRGCLKCEILPRFT